MATLAFRLSGGAAAPLAKLAGTCVEIVFAGIRLCDKLVYASPRLGRPSSSAADRVIMRRRDEENVGQVGSPARR